MSSLARCALHPYNNAIMASDYSDAWGGGGGGGGRRSAGCSNTVSRHGYGKLTLRLFYLSRSRGGNSNLPWFRVGKGSSS